MTDATPRPLVLLVDDFEDARIIYGVYLRYHGLGVAEASNGADAIEIARRLRPDVVLMDLSMPLVDGWEATRELKGDATTSHIPIVALTGHALKGFEEGARRAGCDAVITKPCTPADLLAHLRAILVSSRQAGA